ncbi:MAG: XisI protein [Caldilineaceae bacterium]
MDAKLEKYRVIIKEILTKYMELVNRHPKPDRERLIVFDETHDHYFLHTLGWEDINRIWNTTLFVRIRNGKFYIEIDWTEEGIATELLAAGVPKEDIVLAFHHPSMRPYTEFAVA